MPEYLYRCDKCKEEWFTSLPLSFDPTTTLKCCVADCNGAASRKIGFRHFENRNHIVIKRETLGDWYKGKTGGKTLLGD